jgi:hypothetical protein
MHQQRDQRQSRPPPDSVALRERPALRHLSNRSLGQLHHCLTTPEPLRGGRRLDLKDAEPSAANVRGRFYHLPPRRADLDALAGSDV